MVLGCLPQSQRKVVRTKTRILSLDFVAIYLAKQAVFSSVRPEGLQLGASTASGP